MPLYKPLGSTCVGVCVHFWANYSDENSGDLAARYVSHAHLYAGRGWKTVTNNHINQNPTDSEETSVKGKGLLWLEEWKGEQCIDKMSS